MNLVRRSSGRHFLVFLCLALAIWVAGCSAASLTTPAGDLGTITTAADLSGTAATGTLPSIPLDEGVRATSGDPDNGGGVPPPPGGQPPPPGDGETTQVTVLGKDFLQQWSGEVRGDALQLDPALAGEDSRLAYGLYRVEGLQGKRPLALNVEALPGGIRQEYFVGLADYSNGRWDWFGPCNIPEFQIDLKDRDSRYSSVAGNMYFLVVVHGDNTALHSQSTVTLGPLGGHERPGCPVALRASDGLLPDAVKVEWMAGPGAERFELFRSNARRNEDGDDWRPDWRSIGFTQEQNFLDRNVEPGKPYLYRVRAINEHGNTCFSNADPGFAGQPNGGGEGLDGTILGRIVGPEGNGLPGILVGALGIPAPPPGSGQPPPPPGDFVMTTTGPEGGFAFPHLPAGLYTIVPQNPELDFQPRFLMIGLDKEHQSVTVEFHAVPGQITDALWGFAWTMGGPDHPGLHPVDGATVTITAADTGVTVATTTTDQNGFWIAGGLPNGPYAITCAKEGLAFQPPVRDGHIDGEHMSPARNFFGQPAPPSGGGDPGGGDNGGDPGQP